MIRLPDDANPLSLADWLEASLIAHEYQPARVSDAEIEGALIDSGADVEMLFGDLRREVGRRMRLLDEKYPITRDGYGYNRLAGLAESPHYWFMLLTSLNQHYADLVFASGSAARPAELFENLVERALSRYLGGEVVRIGAPRRLPMPSNFPAAVEHLAQRMHEDFGYGELEIHATGDDGADIVAWRPFADLQPSQMIVLAQCTIGTDWREKRSELDAEVWRRHIRWHTQPVKAFGVPFCHELGNSWRETAARGGIVFDRPRIAALVETADIPNRLRTKIARWCGQRLEQVVALSLG